MSDRHATVGTATTPVTPAAEEPSASETGAKEVKDEDVEMADGPAAVVDTSTTMDVMDDDEGESQRCMCTISCITICFV